MTCGMDCHPQLPQYVLLQMEKSISEHRNIIKVIFHGSAEDACDVMHKLILRGVDGFMAYWHNLNQDT